MKEKAKTLEDLYRENADKIPEAQRKTFKEAVEREKCKKKVRYMSADAAELRAEHFNENDRRTRKASAESRVYKCPHCGFFHLTTNALPGRKK
jgi:rubrerythrin